MKLIRITLTLPPYDTAAENQEWSIQIQVTCEEEPGNEHWLLQGVFVLQDYPEESIYDASVHAKFHCSNETHHAVSTNYSRN